jgi:Flp pilus assembly protein TadD/cell division septation protein DedD
MISTRFVKLAVSGLVLGMALTGGHAVNSTNSTSSAEAKQLQMAATAATLAKSALVASNFRAAVRSAETAVEYAPRDASYRMLLGQSYMSAGRFASAETSFTDALTLSPDNDRGALNLALTQIAQGKHDAAMSTLADYRDKIAASDYGLAVALAGDANTAVITLESAIRAGGSDAKTRQNLALAYAMIGNWASARVMASQDLAGADLDNRIGQWATFVQPKSSYDQVASLLGVRPVQDAGQPTRLALNGVPNVAVASADPSPAAPIEPWVIPAEPVAPATVAVVDTPPPAFETAAAPVRAEAPVIRSETNAIKQVVVPASSRPTPAKVASMPKPSMFKPARSVTEGKFVVQLGAFESAAVSRNSWNRLAPRFGLSAFDPANSVARVRGANFVRLSVGGFVTRADANLVCARVRNAGGNCFVRSVFGDAPAQWVQRGMPKMAKPIRMASR